MRATRLRSGVEQGRLVYLCQFLAAQRMNKAYIGWLNDTRFNRYLSRQRWSERQALAWVRRQNRNPSVRLFSVHRLRDGRMVGTIKLERKGIAGRGIAGRRLYLVEIGVLIGIPGRGYGTEAIRLAMRWARAGWLAGAFRAGIQTANARSIAAFAKAGFEFEPETVWAVR